MDAVTPQESIEKDSEELLRPQRKMGGGYELSATILHERSGRPSGISVSLERYLELLAGGKLINPRYSKAQVQECQRWIQRGQKQ